MAHELEFDSAGEAMMAYAGEVPWHGLGKRVPPDLTPEEFLKEAGLDWDVVKCPKYYEYNDRKFKSKDCALVRTSDGKELATVSGDWHVCQNSEAFEFFTDFVKAGDMEMHTAGSLKEGRRVWVLAKIKDSFEILGRDRIDPFLLFTNPHDYGHVIDIRFTPIRAVCNNTVQLALDGNSDLEVKLNHRKKFDPEWARGVLGIAKTKLETYKDQAEFLASRRNPGGKEMMNYLRKIFPASTAVEAKQGVSRAAKLAVTAIVHQPGADIAQGSCWQLFNSVTFVMDHVLHRKNPAARLNSAWYGFNRKRKLQALEGAIELAKKAPALAA